MLELLSLITYLTISSPIPTKIKCASACDEINNQQICWYRLVNQCAWFEVPCKDLRNTICLPVDVSLGEWQWIRSNNYGEKYPDPASDDNYSR